MKRTFRFHVPGVDEIPFIKLTLDHRALLSMPLALSPPNEPLLLRPCSPFPHLHDWGSLLLPSSWRKCSAHVFGTLYASQGLKETL